MLGGRARGGSRGRGGSPTSMVDGPITATAFVHGLKVATRNIANFRPFEVEIVDPWKG